MTETDNPWDDFLAARVRLIRYLASKGKSDREIVPIVSLSREAQVTQLRVGGTLPSSGADAKAGSAGSPRSFKATYRRRKTVRRNHAETFFLGWRGDGGPGETP